jgi:hypothetical protein
MPLKTSTTVPIDSDILAWLRAQGKGYQSRINAILGGRCCRHSILSLKGASRPPSARKKRQLTTRK